MNKFVTHAMMKIQSPTRALSKVKQLCGNRRSHRHGQLETTSNEIDRGQFKLDRVNSECIRVIDSPTIARSLEKNDSSTDVHDPQCPSNHGD